MLSNDTKLTKNYLPLFKLLVYFGVKSKNSLRHMDLRNSHNEFCLNDAKFTLTELG